MRAWMLVAGVVRESFQVTRALSCWSPFGFWRVADSERRARGNPDVLSAVRAVAVTVGSRLSESAQMSGQQFYNKAK